MEGEFEDTKGVIKIRKSKDRQHNVQKKKNEKRSTKQTHKMINTNPIKNRGCTQVLRKGRKFLHHWWKQVHY
jgi:hypothetical protein